MRRRLIIAAGAALAIVAAFVAGRFAAPEQVVERNVLDESIVAQAVAHARSEWQRNSKEKKTTRVIYRDGKPIEKTVYVDRESTASGSSASDLSAQSQTTRHAETEKTTIRGRPKTRIAAGLGLDLGHPLQLELGAKPVASLDAERQIAAVGPLSLRLYGRAEAPVSNLREVVLEAGGKLALEF